MLRSILSHAGKIPGLGREQLGQSCWEGAEAVVTSGREDSLISVWAAVAPLPIRSKLHASLSATTPVSSLQPPLTRAPLILLSLWMALEQTSLQWLLLFIRLMCTEQSPGLFRSSFVLVFVFCVGSWLCHGCNEEAYQLCANRPSGEDASMDNEQQVGSHIRYTLDLVQLNVLPSSPQCESLLFWSILLCGLSCTHLWIVPALHEQTSK